MRRSVVEIDLRAVRRNAARLREAAGPSELWAVVKADAYGHGAAEVAGAALDAGASALCVVTAQEGELLRERERLVAKVIAVDHFDPDEITGKSAMGHNSRGANAFDKPPHAASSEEIHAAE